jgi:hypothetical protein
MADCDYGTWSTECGCPEHHAPSCWPVPISCCPQLVIGPDTPEAQAEVIERSQRMAVGILNALSGNQFGLCPRTVRPCRDRCVSGNPLTTVWLDGQLLPVLDQGVWYNETCGICRTTDCSCTAVCEVTLRGPVERIISVTLDGAVLPNTSYRVDNHRKLVRTDGECWPVCQDMTLPPTEPNTFEVQYLRGLQVPEEGRFMAGLLACELVKACLPELGECGLPANVTQLAREGVTLDLAPFVLGMNGKTGIPEVDLWLSAVNPSDARTRSRVYSVDRMPPRRRTDCA